MYQLFNGTPFVSRSLSTHLWYDLSFVTSVIVIFGMRFYLLYLKALSFVCLNYNTEKTTNPVKKGNIPMRNM